MIYQHNPRTVEMAAPTRLIAEYKKLLLCDWSETSLHETIDLIERMLKASGMVLQFPTVAKKPAKASKNVVTVDDELVASLLPHLFPVFAPFAIAAPDLRQLKVAQWDFVALRSFCGLTIQLMVSIEKDSGLLRDCQSLLFLQSAQSVLPMLKEHGAQTQHDSLVAAMLYHANNVWIDNDSHRLYLLSEIANYLGEHEFEGSALYQSFLLTPSDDHSYMTAVQQYWSYLLAQNSHAQAKEFLLHAYKRGPVSAGEEIRELLDLTYESSAAK